MKTINVRVTRIASAAIDIKSFEVVPLGDERLPSFKPGAHIDLHLPTKLVRQYSLCGDPAERDRYRFAVKRDSVSRGGSAWIHENVREGDTLVIGEPRCAFSLDDTADFHLLLAAGIGITPMLSMLSQLVRKHSDFHLHYFSRAPQYAAFRDSLSAPHVRDRVTLHYSCEGNVRDTSRRIVELRPTRDSHLYMCGPTSFMEAARSHAATSWPVDSIHQESFAPDAKALAAPKDSFEVTILGRNLTLQVPANKTIVQVLAEQGIRVPVSCEQGVCGTCLTRVVEGVPEHRDVFLSDQEKSKCDQMLPCVSRSRSPRLVLAL